MDQRADNSIRTIRIVLPAFNEASNIGAVLVALASAQARTSMRFHAVVVNDGSSDGTGDVVRAFRGGIQVSAIDHETNQGLGAAIRTGLLHAIGASGPSDVVVTMDADDTHTPSAISEMVAQIDSGLDVVIASRYRPGSVVSGVPAHRRFMSDAASWLFRLVFPIPGVRDFTCGYRAYRAPVLAEAVNRYRDDFINQEGFQCMVDILLKLSRMNLRFGEVPITLRYDRKAGKSKMKVLRTVVSTLLLLFRRRLGF
jgi:dolichol-phosphate mannosyltransferase